MTITAYRLPSDATPTKVIDFYDRALIGEWEQVIVRGMSINCEVSYRRGEAILGVKACNEHVILQIDHGGAS